MRTLPLLHCGVGSSELVGSHRHRTCSRDHDKCAAAGITPTLAWTLLNAGIALFGYYATAWLIDDISWGRYRIQVSLLPEPRVLQGLT